MNPLDESEFLRGPAGDAEDECLAIVKAFLHFEILECDATRNGTGRTPVGVCAICPDIFVPGATERQAAFHWTGQGGFSIYSGGAMLLQSFARDCPAGRPPIEPRQDGLRSAFVG